MKKVNNNTKRTILFLLLFLLVFLLWGNAVYYGQYIEEYYKSVSIRMKEASVSKHMLLQAVENEQQQGNQELREVSAWNRVENKSLQCEELNTKAKVQLIEVVGDMEQVYPIELVDGSIPAADDYEGCLIDEGTAYALFHTANTVGNMVTYDGRLYCIRGVLRSTEPVCLLELYDEERTYSNLELVFMDKENGSQLAADFLRLLGIADQYVTIDGSLSAGMLKPTYLLPAWLLGFCLMYDLISVLWRRRTIPLQALALIMLILLMGLMLCWIIDVHISIPQQFIPTKWSDFSFWNRKVTELQDWRSSLDYIAPNNKDIIFRQFSKRCLFYTITATIGMLALITHERMLFHGNSKAGKFILTALLECSVVCVLFLTGSIFSLPRAYLAMPIFYMLAQDAFRWYRNRRL